LDPARSNQYVRVTETIGVPGAGKRVSYDALIDTFYTRSEFSEVIAVHRFSPMTAAIQETVSAPVERTTTGIPMTVERPPTENIEEQPAPEAVSECETFYILRFPDGVKYRFSC